MRFPLHRLAPLLLLLAGCRGEPAAPAATRAFTDDRGRRLDVPAAVERVVSLAPSMTEIVVAAGGASRLAGVTTADDYPPLVDSLPRFGALPLDFERILRLRPDLAVATDQVNNPRDAEALGELGVPTAFFSFRRLADVPRAIRRTGELIGTAAAAGRAADSLAARIDSMEARSRAAGHRPSVLVLAGDRTLYSFGAESYVNELVRLAGGRSITEELPGQAPVVSDEFVLEEQPEVILGLLGEAYDPAELVRLHPTWRLVPAVRDGRVHVMSQELISRPGPRLVEGALRLAALLRPAPAGAASGRAE